LFIREFFVSFLASLALLERRFPAFMWLGKGRYAAAKRRAAKSRPTPLTHERI
jgi:hypothetical protein